MKNKVENNQTYLDLSDGEDLMFYSKIKTYKFYIEKYFKIDAFHPLGRVLLHREDGPAYSKIHINGQPIEIGYFIDGESHRENGPSRILYSANGNILAETYCISGNPHRECGPYLIEYDNFGLIKSEFYALNGVVMTKQQYDKLLPQRFHLEVFE